VIGLLTFSIWFWWIGQPLLFAITLTITVFVIVCPDALGLATPMAVMVGTGIHMTSSARSSSRLLRYARCIRIWWAVGYNVIAFPLAAGVFYPLMISPEIAALAMSESSALVAINALMLKRTKLPGIGVYDASQPVLRAVEATA
jgi:cation transport ATPase